MAEIEQYDEIEVGSDNKDIVIELNTNQGHTSAKEMFMKGEFHSVIIDLNKQSDIKIRFRDYPDIVLLDVVSFRPGASYIPLRVDTFGFDMKMFNYQNSKWLLNDNIEVIINGSIETEARFIFRFE